MEKIYNMRKLLFNPVFLIKQWVNNLINLYVFSVNPFNFKK